MPSRTLPSSIAIVLVAGGLASASGLGCSSKVSGSGNEGSGGVATASTTASGTGGNAATSTTASGTGGSGAGCPGMQPVMCSETCDYPNACGVQSTDPTTGCCVIAILPDGTSCGGTNICRKGLCVACDPCSPGGPCVDHTADPNNCGACGNVCAADQVCKDSACTCPGVTPAACGGACADLASDPNNCGACGNVCGSGLGCSGGECHVVLASGLDAPVALVIDGAEAIWVNEETAGQGSIAKVPLAGGAVTTLASGISRPIGLALDATSVYWTDIGGSVKEMPRAGGAVTTLAACESPYGAPFVGGGSAYWVNMSGDLRKVSLAGGAVTTLASNAWSPFAVGGGDAYWLGAWGSTPGASAIVKVSLAGGAPSKVADTTDYRALAIATDATNVYWASSGGTLNKVPLAGGAVVKLASVPWTDAMAVDGDSLYLATETNVLEVPIAGGAPTTLATLAKWQTAMGIAVDAASVYWTNAGTGQHDGAVVKAPR